MFYVFNAYELHGYAFKTRSKLLARIVCALKGRYYDFGTIKDVITH